TCTGSPDCAASRTNVPAGCTGQAVMVFGESFYYQLPAPLTIGTSYTIDMAVSTGTLFSGTISGNHTFNVIGLTSAPSNCSGANYGSVCNTPGAVVLLSGTQNNVGWLNFSNTFTATSAITHIVLGNCDMTGNGGNLLCNISLTTAVPFAHTEAWLDVKTEGCAAALEWQLEGETADLTHFEVMFGTEGLADQSIARIPVEQADADGMYRFQTQNAAPEGYYQLRLVFEDGQDQHSNMVHTLTDCLEEGLHILGNPVANEQLSIRLYTKESSETLFIYDLRGKVVHREVFSASTGWADYHFDLQGLSPGLYLLQTASGHTKKLELLD
ncbi:MAG: T9SS type A sorting domain-containing protein, partial [Bacteroidota bacterium]